MTGMETVVFPDVESGLLDGLKGRFAELADGDGPVDYHVGADVPRAGARPTLMERLPFVRVQILSGSDNFFSDFPTVSIDVFGATRSATYPLAEAIRAWLLAAPLVAGGVAIDSATTRSRPAWLPWEGDNVRRRGATYELSVRRR